jgi:hypothetical protein
MSVGSYLHHMSVGSYPPGDGAGRYAVGGDSEYDGTSTTAEGVEDGEGESGGAGGEDE